MPCRIFSLSAIFILLAGSLSWSQDQRSPDHWFNTANFETASARQLLGNQVRTWPLRIPTLRGPKARISSSGRKP